ncbi:MAG: 16S rRNA (cytosine(1402)-N(4))-methyltransferase RsmH [Pseudomonadota bacterium]|nr:16S rRNA (cytosine(1402)-N(4))-methyltransferase RsmH [Pseudomonadota bacterium]
MDSRKISTGGPYYHTPVMTKKVLDALSLRGGSVFVDGTFGGGGHSSAILDLFDCIIIATDRDVNSVPIAKKLNEKYQDRINFYNASYTQIPNILDSLSIKAVDGLLLDLGVSSMQIDDPKRGFSFQNEGPLDMRMGKNTISAHDVVNKMKEEHLSEIISDFGEEKYSRIIASRINDYRQKNTIKTTTQLSKIINDAVGNFYKKQKGAHIHPATRTFQAIRVFVNNEFEELYTLLIGICDYIKIGGRIAIITFHSIEDRIVKNIFDHLTGCSSSKSRYEPEIEDHANYPFTYPDKKFYKPDQDEIAENPRSRSAKLRYIQRTEYLFRENLDIYSMTKYKRMLEELK